MPERQMDSSGIANRLLELGVVALAFASCYGIYFRFFDNDLPLSKTLGGCVAAILAFWISSQVKDDLDDRNSWVVFVEQFCFGTGVSLLVHALITYGLLTRRTPVLVVSGSCIAAIAITVWRRYSRDRAPLATILLVGFDSLSQRLVNALRPPVIGVCGPCMVDPPLGVPYLGGIENFSRIVRERQPTRILIGPQGRASGVSAAELLECRLNGIQVIHAATLYEKLFSRICCERLQPAEMVLSSALRGDSRTMAIQAVYNNLIGLSFLLVMAIPMLLVGLAIALSSGAGPVIESIECAGFQYIPFRLQRFRTTRADGSVTSTGRLVRRLGLANLPHLINVVRGDMALVGPRPARKEFAQNLAAVLPYYTYRFSVKPGIVGWAQLHLSEEAARDAYREIEYDLYYIKQSSVWLDLEILVERLQWRRVLPSDTKTAGGAKA